MAPRNMAFALAFFLAMLAGAGALVGLNDVAADADAPRVVDGCEITRADDNSTQYSKLTGIVARGGTNVLLLGTSRTKTGFGPDVRKSLGPATNAALLGASFETMRIMLAHWPGRRGDRVIIEASFGTAWRNGLEHWTRPPNTSDKLVSGLDPRPIVTAMLEVGIRERTRTDCRGFPMAQMPPATASRFERYAIFWREEIQHADWQRIMPGLDGLRAVIRDALDRGFRVDVWIPPENACQLEGAHLAGDGPAREAWLRGVAGMTGLTARDGSRGFGVTAWNFSGYSPITTEPLPDAGSAWQSRYFSDPGHMLRVVGDRVALQLAGQPVPEGEVGWRLSPATVDAHLAGQVEARRAYLAREPEAARCVAAKDTGIR